MVPMFKQVYGFYWLASARLPNHQVFEARGYQRNTHRIHICVNNDDFDGAMVVAIPMASISEGKLLDAAQT